MAVNTAKALLHQPLLREQGLKAGVFMGVRVVAVLPPRHLVESRCLKATDTHPADKREIKKEEGRDFKTVDLDSLTVRGMFER